jgi:hypothetical protein
MFSPGFISQYNNNFVIADSLNVSQSYATPDLIESNEMKLNSDNRYDRIVSDFMDLNRDYYNGSGASGMDCAGMYGYSFALSNNQFQPSGTCNFSRLGKKQLLLYFKDLTTNAPRTMAFNNSYSILLLAENINFFRIIGGLAGQEFDN